jgi:hypothetical protein
LFCDMFALAPASRGSQGASACLIHVMSVNSNMFRGRIEKAFHTYSNKQYICIYIHIYIQHLHLSELHIAGNGPTLRQGWASSDQRFPTLNQVPNFNGIPLDNPRTGLSVPTPLPPYAPILVLCQCISRYNARLPPILENVGNRPFLAVWGPGGPPWALPGGGRR